MSRGGRNPQPLLSHRDGRIIDSLDIDAMFLEQHVTRLLGDLGIAHKHRDDVRRVGHDRDISLHQRILDSARVQLLQVAIALVLHLVLDSGFSTRHGGWRKRSSEDEAWSKGADGINHFGRASNVAANAAVGFAQGAGNDIDAVHDGAFRAASSMGLEIEMFSNAGTTGSVHSDGVDLVEKGNGAIFGGEVADLGDGADGAAHGVDRFEGDDFGSGGRDGGEFGFEIVEVVVREDELACA